MRQIFQDLVREGENSVCKRIFCVSRGRKGGGEEGQLNLREHGQKRAFWQDVLQKNCGVSHKIFYFFAKMDSHKNTDEVAYTTSSKFSGPCMCMEICEIPERGESGDPRSYRSSFAPRSVCTLQPTIRNKKPLRSPIANLGREREREIEEIEETVRF